MLHNLNDTRNLTHTFLILEALERVVVRYIMALWMSSNFRGRKWVASNVPHTSVQTSHERNSRAIYNTALKLVHNGSPNGLQCFSKTVLHISLRVLP